MNINIRKDFFFKILGLNSISIVLKILMGVISTKLISIYIGLQGINLLEYFRNFSNIAESVSQMGLQNGIVKKIATTKTQKEQEQKIFSTALGITGSVVFIIVIFSILFSNHLQQYLFHSTAFEGAFLLFLFSLPATVLQMIIISILNGKQLFKKIIWVNSIGYLINILLSFFLITKFELQGALFQIAITPILLWLFTWIYSYKNLSGIRFSIIYFDKDIAKDLLGFTLMNLASGILVPFSLIFIRNQIESNLGETDAGIWSTIVRLSSFYMLFVSSICGLYFFPLLSKNENLNHQKKILAEYYKKLVPLVAIGLFLCYHFQEWLIEILYTQEFLPITNYFYFQLIADFIKTCAFIFGYQLIANRKVKHFILFEILSVGSYMLITHLLIPDFGLIGVFISRLISITIYLFSLIILYLSNK